MGRKPSEVIKDSVIYLDNKILDKDDKGNVILKARYVEELCQALRDKDLCY